MEIDYLTQHPHLLRQLAPPMFKEWGYHNNEKTVEDRVRFMERRMNLRQIPTCFVAFNGKNALGTASLIECDVPTRSHLTPWLASVFVLEPQRGKGIAAKLIEHAIQEARALEIERLYLTTVDANRYYERFGFREIERTENHGDPAIIMVKKLTEK